MSRSPSGIWIRSPAADRRASEITADKLQDISERNFVFELGFDSRTCKFRVTIYELPDRRFVHRTKSSGNHDKCFRAASAFVADHLRSQETDDEQIPRLPFGDDKETE